METLTKVAPEDPQVVKTIIDLRKFTTPNQLLLTRRGFRQITTTPFRDESVQLLGEIAEGQPQHRKQIIPPLVSALKESVQGTKAAHEQLVLQAIQEVEETGTALLKCGRDAKQALTKEVLPRLLELKFHPSDSVRTTANQLRMKIEDTLKPTAPRSTE
jgi:hypothetical protein